ncbi:MAG: class I SAM-dependent methyltransferase [Kineosporiaceae bacterium]
MTLDTSAHLLAAPDAAPQTPLRAVVPAPARAAGLRLTDAVAPVAPGSPYDSPAFVARYAAVWAWGAADPDRTSEPYYRHLLDAALDPTLDGGTRALVAHAEAPARVLDAGCGPGRVLGELARRLPGARCTGIDASAVMIGLADRLLRGRPEDAVELDAGDYGFAPVRLTPLGRADITLHARTLAEHAASGPGYDLVVASHLLDRVPAPRAALADLAAMVAPGGRLVVSCAFNYDRRDSWQLATAGQLRDALAELGLQPLRVEEAVSYRERLDIRGTVTEHVVALVVAGRPAC